MSKVFASADDAVADIVSGSSVAVGGFGVCGMPTVLLEALYDRGAEDLTIVSNNCGTGELGPAKLLSSGRVRHVIASYVGDNKILVSQYLAGALSVELIPQGTLAERLRAGGAGIEAFYTPTGADTDVAFGGLPIRFDSRGTVEHESAPKERRIVNGRACVLEEAIRCDFGVVRAWLADEFGNLVFRKAARNFNPLCAMAGRVAIVEAERIVARGELDPDQVHLPGAFVQRVVQAPSDLEKPIEKLTLRTPKETA